MDMSPPPFSPSSLEDAARKNDGVFEADTHHHVKGSLSLTTPPDALMDEASEERVSDELIEEAISGKSPAVVIDAQEVEDDEHEQEEDLQVGKEDEDDSDVLATRSENGEKDNPPHEDETTDNVSHESTPAPPARECGFLKQLSTTDIVLTNFALKSSAEHRNLKAWRATQLGIGRGKNRGRSLSRLKWLMTQIRQQRHLRSLLVSEAQKVSP